MSEPIQISAKTLGQLALSNFCPRCFWIRLHNPQLPYQIFPGVFSSIDAFSKKVTALYFQRHLRLPQWLKPIGLNGCPLAVPHWSKFNYTDPETNIRLSGVPDEIFRLPGRTAMLAILDYKTARYTDTQDELAPMYRVQLNAYSVIAQETALGRVKSLWLAYYEPLTNIGVDDLSDLVDDDSVAMRFAPKVIPVGIDQTMIPPLLKRAREIYDLVEPPPTRDGCKDCRLLQNLLNLVTMGKAA
jgi:PD-(D/E)XK nuclease superfamily